jgi:hypothetical protein
LVSKLFNFFSQFTIDNNPNEMLYRNKRGTGRG